MQNNTIKELLETIRLAFVTTKHSDSKLEPINVSDGLYELANAIKSVSKTLDGTDSLGGSIVKASEIVSKSLDNIAEAIRNTK